MNDFVNLVRLSKPPQWVVQSYRNNDKIDYNFFILFLQPETEGFLAVVLPKLTENILDGLLTKEEYEKLLEDRKALNGT